MEKFCEEIAVLQAAMFLADKKFPKGLTGFKVNGDTSSSEVMDILMYAICEICDGIEVKWSESDAQRWGYKLTALFTHLMLRHEAGDFISDNNTFDAVLVNMPNINSVLHWEIMKKCDWRMHVIKVLHSMDVPVGQKVLSCLLDNITEEPTKEDSIKMTIAALEYICLSKNPYTKTLLSGQEFIKKLLGVVNVFAFNKDCLNGSSCTLIFVTLLNLLRGILTGSMEVLNFTEMTSSFAEPIRVDLPNGAYLNLVDVEQDLAWTVVELRDQDFVTAVSIATTINKLLDCSMASVSEHVLDQNCTIGSFLSQIIHPELTNSVCRRFLLSNTTALLDWQNNTRNESEKSIEELLGKLKSLSSSVRNEEAVVHQAMDRPAMKFERALYVVQHRIRGYKDMAKWLTSNRERCHHEDPRWLTCLEDNQDVFCGVDLWRNLWELLSELINSSSDLSQLSRILIKLFSKLSLEQQDGIIHIVHTPVNSDLLTYDPEEVNRELPEVFNKLVHIEDKNMSSELLKSLSRLCLLSPSTCLLKLVHCAVTNKAQTMVLTQVLRTFPSLCVIHQENQAPLIVTSLHSVLQEPLSTKQHQNTAAFCQALLTSDNKTSPTSLVSHRDFMTTCIFPRLSNDVSDWSTSLPLTFQLLAVVLETLRTLKADWSVIKQCMVLPLVVYLGQVIEGSSLLVDELTSEDVEVKVQLKEQAIVLMKEIIQILLPCKRQIPSSELEWLKGRLCDVDCHVMLHVTPLICDNNQILDAFVPVCFKSSHHDIASTELNANDYSCLLKVARVNTQCLEYVKSLPGLPCLRNNSELLPRLKQALSQELMDSVAEEWTLLLSFIHHLIKEAILVVPDSMTNSQHTVIQSAVFLTSAVQLMGESQSASSQLWSHIAASYTTAIKEFCLSRSKILNSTNDLLSLLEEILHLQNSIPVQCNDTLQVLALDLLTSIHTSLKNLNSDVEADPSGSLSRLEVLISGVKQLDSRSVYEKTLSKMKSDGNMDTV